MLRASLAPRASGTLSRYPEKLPYGDCALATLRGRARTVRLTGVERHSLAAIVRGPHTPPSQETTCPVRPPRQSTMAEHGHRTPPPPLREQLPSVAAALPPRPRARPPGSTTPGATAPLLRPRSGCGHCRRLRAPGPPRTPPERVFLLRHRPRDPSRTAPRPGSLYPGSMALRGRLATVAVPRWEGTASPSFPRFSRAGDRPVPPIVARPALPVRTSLSSPRMRRLASRS